MVAEHFGSQLQAKITKFILSPQTHKIAFKHNNADSWLLIQ